MCLSTIQDQKPARRDGQKSVLVRQTWRAVFNEMCKTSPGLIDVKYDPEGATKHMQENFAELNRCKTTDQAQSDQAATAKKIEILKQKLATSERKARRFQAELLIVFAELEKFDPSRVHHL